MTYASQLNSFLTFDLADLRSGYCCDPLRVQWGDIEMLTTSRLLSGLIQLFFRIIVLYDDNMTKTHLVISNTYKCLVTSYDAIKSS